mmetsp:Transcript_66451/g.133881  ORF Transcript_66451/g.133881 Transcript_66451/m.133881 type:complete len:365 (+) Transcript_66451:300-1394(+)
MSSFQKTYFNSVFSTMSDQGRGLQFGAWMRLKNGDEEDDGSSKDISENDQKAKEKNDGGENGEDKASSDEFKDNKASLYKKRREKYNSATEQKMVAFLKHSSRMYSQGADLRNDNGDCSANWDKSDHGDDACNDDARDEIGGRTVDDDVDRVELPLPHSISLQADAQSGAANDPLLYARPKGVHVTFNQHELETSLARSFLDCLFLNHLTATGLATNFSTDFTARANHSTSSQPPSNLSKGATKPQPPHPPSQQSRSKSSGSTHDALHQHQRRRHLAHLARAFGLRHVPSPLHACFSATTNRHRKSNSGSGHAGGDAGGGAESGAESFPAESDEGKDLGALEVARRLHEWNQAAWANLVEFRIE